MMFRLVTGAIFGLSCFTSSAAFAEVDFGTPDFPNYISRPGAVSCDWTYDNYFRACPTPVLPPKPQKPAKPSASKNDAKE